MPWFRKAKVGFATVRKARVGAQAGFATVRKVRVRVSFSVRKVSVKVRVRVRVSFSVSFSVRKVSRVRIYSRTFLLLLVVTELIYLISTNI